jgi:dihydrofolate synthase/folylpolyglutamate synthase
VIKPPLCSVIATIGLDHTAVLGDTLEKIAEQKCGIIKPGSVAVTSNQEAAVMRVIAADCRQKQTPLIESSSIKIKVEKSGLDGSVFDFDGIKLRLPLAGAHQLENAKTALAALSVLKEKSLISCTAQELQKGFEAAVNPGRLELLCGDPIVLLDGAHNPNGIGALQKAIKEFLSEKEIICVMGMLADKDIDSAISLLPGLFTKVYTVPIDNPRAIGSAELAKKFAAHGMAATAFETPFSAFDKAFEEARSDGSAVLICGSLYLAGEIRPHILDRIKK